MAFRLLFVLLPPRDQADQMCRLGGLLKRGYNLPGRRLPPHLIHLTLHWLGDHDDGVEPLLARAKQAAVTTSVPTFEVAFNRIESWGDALVLRAEEGLTDLVSLHRTLGAALRQVGLGRYLRPSFTPHISLLRGENHVEPQQVMTFRWPVLELVLVTSLLGRSRHVVIDKWPLRAHD